MFLIVGALIGFNLCVRIVLGETRERRLAGRVGTRGESRLRVEDYFGIAWRGLVFLMIPVAIGLVLDNVFGSGISEIMSD